jgi:nucleoid-associated protein YgaU
MPYVVVRRGDTLGEIMQETLGSAFRYKDEVMELNEDLDPDRMRQGTRVWLPARRLLSAPERRQRREALAASMTPRREPEPRADSHTLYRTKKGDSLWRIAHRFYGTGRTKKGVERIRRANQDVDLDPLQPDTTLRIPK